MTMTVESNGTTLTDYVKKNPGFTHMYTSYEPDMAILKQINAVLPTAHVVVVSEYWCGDSRRLVPRMARIAELLPGWTFESKPWDSTARAKPLQARAIPTFIIFSGDEELGRIVENPLHGSIEADLLDIASAPRL